MKDKNISRRGFLRLTALTAAGATLAACTPKAPVAEAPVVDVPAAPPAAPAAKQVVLDVMAPVSEYEGAYREIWNVFEAEHPDIKINLFSINEDTAAAHDAKVAGGYLPAFENTQEMQLFFNKDNYQTALDLSKIDFPWFDRWTYNVKSAWSDLYDLPGPRSLDIFQGFVFTWQYNADLMDRSGLDPVRDVKSWNDLRKWLDDGAAWAKAEGDVDYFWNQAWHNWVFGMVIMDLIPLAFADGTRQDQIDCFLGKKKFNGADSPYRHTYEFFKEANDKGWIPESMWTRQWEGDMEASYIAGKSVMMLHGPWVWDKALAAGSTFKQSGLPSTPPADGQTWLQGALPPTVDAQYFIRTGVDKLPEWEQIRTAWNWFFSPKAIPMRAQAEGRMPLYKMDSPLDLKGPQFQNCLKDIAPGGKFADIVYEEGLNGLTLAGPHMKKGAQGVWDWQANGNNQVFADLLTGKITVQGALDIAQRNWDESYEGLPEA
jgi:ABC-type glycerol-3-phosphate transport system substrate-binding protein